MTTIASEAGRRAWGTVPRVRLWLENVRPVTLLAAGDRAAVALDARPSADRPPQRLALLPGRRPALVLRERLAAGTRNASVPARGSASAGASRAAQRHRRPGPRARTPHHRAGERPRPRSRRAPVHLRDRAADRRTRLRLLGDAALARRAADRDQVHRPRLSPAVHRGDAPAVVRPDGDGRLSVDGRRPRLRLLRLQDDRQARCRRCPRVRSRRGCCDRRQAVKLDIPRGTDPRLRVSEASAPSCICRARPRARARDAGLVEVPGPRLRADPARRGSP